MVTITMEMRALLRSMKVNSLTTVTSIGTVRTKHTTTRMMKLTCTVMKMTMEMRAWTLMKCLTHPTRKVSLKKVARSGVSWQIETKVTKSKALRSRHRQAIGVQTRRTHTLSYLIGTCLTWAWRFRWDSPLTKLMRTKNDTLSRQYYCTTESTCQLTLGSSRMTQMILACQYRSNSGRLATMSGLPTTVESRTARVTAP